MRLKKFMVLSFIKIVLNIKYILGLGLLISASAIFANQVNSTKSDIKPIPLVGRLITSPNNIAAQECPELDNFVIKFMKSFPNQKLPYSETHAIFINNIRILMKGAEFKNLEKLALNNTACGAQVSGFLLDIYSLTESDSSAKDAYERLLTFAKKNNQAAISSLCISDNEIINVQVKTYYCEKIFNSQNLTYNENIKDLAPSILEGHYLKTNQPEKLLDLCIKINDNTLKTDCFNYVRMLANNIYYKNEYQKAFYLYDKIQVYDNSGLSQIQLAEMYQLGQGTQSDLYMAIYWYKQALQYLKPDDFFYLIALNDMGAAYEGLLNYQAAFKCYYRASIMGSANSQLNLAELYVNGHGVLQDSEQAYAWVSIAIAKGLGNASRQQEAENLRDSIVIMLATEDPSGNKLNEAKNLAKQYFVRYAS